MAETSRLAESRHVTVTVPSAARRYARPRADAARPAPPPLRSTARRALRRRCGRGRPRVARRAAGRRRRAPRPRLPAQPPRAAARAPQRLEAGRARGAGGALPARSSAARRAISVRVVPPEEIDRNGLHRSNLWGLRSVLSDLAPPAEACLVDGFRLGPLAPPHRAVVDGDTKSAAIAAASIVAKVTRDRVMRRMDALFPRYGFRSHVGYITPGHSAAVRASRAVRAAPHCPFQALCCYAGLDARDAPSRRRSRASSSPRCTTWCAATASSAATSGQEATSSI